MHNLNLNQEIINYLTEMTGRDAELLIREAICIVNETKSKANKEFCINLFKSKLRIGTMSSNMIKEQLLELELIKEVARSNGTMYLIAM